MRILLVEDNEVDYFIASQVIKEVLSGVVIDWVMDGQEALDTLSEDDTYDLIFLDLNMPGMNGLRFLEVYNDSQLKKVPVYPLTSSTNKQDVEKCSSYSFVRHYLNKPILPTYLQNIIDEQ